jgi:hypothetical protein
LQKGDSHWQRRRLWLTGDLFQPGLALLHGKF